MNADPDPTRTDIDSTPGAVLLEFGAWWCGYCQSAKPLIEAALQQFPQARHIKVEDGKGRPLGRSFSVKLWPTLIFLTDGEEKSRLVRPSDRTQIEAGLRSIT
ncbi:thioredoxin 1 [Povalibacter uvarum]|uniref:Thioredoxin 1 n=1 Tax=Povalibacter uvarum TaxID=732238 RepID=A0A841HM58_9GAMM|nr:thioredoxin family protein [Povalibacter uvarum]MBB6093684.1 thioredoxin 1 [Povalibacter uvarum]